MNLEYLGSVGTKANTPVGVVAKGEVVDVADRIGKRMLATGNFKLTDAPPTRPKEASPFTDSATAKAAAAAAATPAPQPATTAVAGNAAAPIITK